jgi:hypothetical protein
MVCLFSKIALTLFFDYFKIFKVLPTLQNMIINYDHQSLWQLVIMVTIKRIYHLI